MAHPVAIFESVCAVLSSRSQLRIRDCLVATPDAIVYEASQLATMRSTAPVCLTATWPFLGIFAYLLTAGERDRCRQYMQRFAASSRGNALADPDLVCNLGDNPAGGWLTWSAPPQRHGCTSSGIHRLPTLRRSWTLQWLPAYGRWLTGSERLALMGFPSTEPLARVYGLSGHFNMPWRCRHL